MTRIRLELLVLTVLALNLSVSACGRKSASDREMSRLAGRIESVAQGQVAVRRQMNSVAVAGRTEAVGLDEDMRLVVRQSYCGKISRHACGRRSAADDWSPLALTVRLSNVDSAAIRIDGVEKSSDGLLIVLPCMPNVPCVETPVSAPDKSVSSNGGNGFGYAHASLFKSMLDQTTGSTLEAGPIALGCKDDKRCERLASDLKALITAVASAPDALHPDDKKSARQNSAAEKRLAKLAAKIERDIKDARVERAATGSSPILVAFLSRDAQIDELGRLAVRQSFCTALGLAQWGQCDDAATAVRGELGAAVDLRQIDASSIAVKTFPPSGAPGDFNKTRGALVIAPCRDETPCVEFETPGDDASYTTLKSMGNGRERASGWARYAFFDKDAPFASAPREADTKVFLLACANDKQCAQTADDLRKLVELAIANPPPAPKTAESPTPPDRVIAERLNAALRGKSAMIREGGHLPTTMAFINAVSRIGRDAVRLEYFSCARAFGRDICLDVGIDNLAYVAGETQIDLDKIDFVAAWARAPSEYIQDKDDFYIGSGHVRLACKAGAQCFRHSLTGEDGAAVANPKPDDFGFTCKTGADCAAILLDLRALADFSAGKPPTPAPATSIDSEADAKTVAGRILSYYGAGGHERTYDKTTGATIILQPRRMRAGDDNLTIDFGRCEAVMDPAGCSFNADAPAMSVKLPLYGYVGADRIDLERSAVIYKDELDKEYQVQLFCRQNRLCTETGFDDPQIKPIRAASFSLDCPDAPRCERLLVDIAALIEWGARSKGKANFNIQTDGVPYVDTVVRKESDTDVNASSCSGYDCMDISDADVKAVAEKDFKEKVVQFAALIAGGAVDVSVKGDAPALRRLTSKGAELGDDGRMIIRRAVCKALLAPNVDQSSECKTAGLYLTYDLSIDLAAVNPESIVVKKADPGRGEKGRIVAAQCAGVAPCASFAGATPPLQIVQELGDGGRVRIKVPCNPANCEAAAAQLKVLIAAGAKSDTPTLKPVDIETRRSDDTAPPQESAAPILARLNAQLSGRDFSAFLIGVEGKKQPLWLEIADITVTQNSLNIHSAGDVTININVINPYDDEIVKQFGSSMVLLNAIASNTLKADGEALEPTTPIVFDCASEQACAAAALDMRNLIKLIKAPGFIAPGPAARVSEIAGVWELYVPAPGGFSRWLLEFASDNKYKFTDTTNGASHQGTYKAENGKWSLDGNWTKNSMLPPGAAFTDHGTYRLLNADAMEFVGQLGPAVWKKATAP